MANIEIRQYFDQLDPHGNPIILLKINGRTALFAKQLASTFEGSLLGHHLIKKLESSELFFKDLHWLTIDYSQLIDIQEYEKASQGESSLEKLLSPMNASGEPVIFEAAALWLLARSDSKRGKEFAKNLVETYLSVKENIDTVSKDFKRLEARKKLLDSEKKFVEIIYDKGVITSNDIAEVKNDGDKAFFTHSTRNMKKRYGIENKEALADYLPLVTIKAKDLIFEMTSLNAKEKELYGKDSISEEHQDNSRAVRKVFIERLQFAPENLPPEEDIKKIQKKYLKEGVSPDQQKLL